MMFASDSFRLQTNGKRPMRLEALEVRETPAVLSALHPGGALVINITTAPGGTAAHVTVIQGFLRVNDAPVYFAGTGTPARAADVTSIRVNGSPLGDVINLQNVNKVTFPRIAHQTVVFGNDGNDRITGTQYSDYLDGGLGADTISGQGGNDILIGNRGKDVLYGDAGDDKLYGGDHFNMFFGGAGHDTVFGYNKKKHGPLSPSASIEVLS